MEFGITEITRACLVFGTAFVFTFVVIPFVIRIVRHDKSQTWLSSSTIGFVNKPALGGLTIFLGTLITICFWVPFETIPHIQYYFSALFIILILGIKDDFEPLKPGFKLIVQFCAAGVLVFYANLYLDYVILQDIIYSKILSLITIVFLMNAINFIDGINALCSAIVVLITITLGSYFLIINELALALIALALAGSVFGFLYYNITPARIFMGDTGSLTIGTVIAILGINYLNINASDLEIGQSPSFLFAVLIIPILDGVRVIVGRIIKFKSPLNKDKSHIHHILLTKGFSHMQSTALLVSINILFIIMAYNLQHLGTLILIILQIFIAIALFIILLFYKSIYLRKEKIQKSF